MRRFRRAALTAAVVAGLSALGAGVGHADDSDDPQQVSAVATAQADAVVTWGAPDGERHSYSHATRHPAKKHGHKRQAAKKHEDKRPTAKKHEGKRPAVKKHEQKGPAAMRRDDERPAAKRHEHEHAASSHVHQRWVSRHSHSRMHGAGVERFSSTSVTVHTSVE
ncbi:hypothetical protein ACFZCP_12885 [Streptomyces sp. NPDC007971]|uniref:hypothetical protein n=1 Tax=Streptomyces sp. NPDC007971 TaxID=3364799 RepID=UPI0036E59CED